MKAKNISYIVLVVSILLLLFDIIFFISIKNNKNTKEVKNDGNVIEKLMCYKKTSNDNFDTKNTYIYDIEKDGSISNQQYVVENIFKDKKIFDIEKNYKSDNFRILSNSSKNQLLFIYDVKEMKDLNGKKLHVWYYDYKEQLEDADFKCEIKKITF